MPGGRAVRHGGGSVLDPVTVPRRAWPPGRVNVTVFSGKHHLKWRSHASPWHCSGYHGTVMTTDCLRMF
eukprot:530565-Hanusia_phi.AAC.1